MNQNKDELFLTDILEFCSHIGEYVEKVERAEFLNNRLLQDALIRKIELIGEAAKGLTEEIRGENPNVPWKEIMRMRDKVVHHYFRGDLDVVWKTVSEDIPVLKRWISKIIENIQNS